MPLPVPIFKFKNSEYLSDKKIYKILIFVDTKKSGNKIREIKIDQKE